MTYETGAGTDLEDLLSKLDTFAATTHGGWNSDYTTNPQTTDGWFSLTKGNLNFSLKYPVGAQGPPVSMSIHHATAFGGTSTAPGAHTADSGNGYNTGTTGHTNANLETERCVRDIGDGPYQSYHFFADATATHDYIHCVAEVIPGMFRHFGFGELVKFGDDWVGSEYVYGHYQEAATNAIPTDPNTQVLLDGLGASQDRTRCATLRIASGMPNQGSAVWGCSNTQIASNLLTDTAGNSRVQVHGGYRCGIEARGFGNIIGNTSSGLVSLYSIAAYYRDPSNPRAILMGYMPDVRGFNTRNFQPGEEITIGSDTWVLFPQSIRTSSATAYRSKFSGIAYKKVS